MSSCKTVYFQTTYIPVSRPAQVVLVIAIPTLTTLLQNAESWLLTQKLLITSVGKTSMKIGNCFRYLCLVYSIEQDRQSIRKPQGNRLKIHFLVLPSVYSHEDLVDIIPLRLMVFVIVTNVILMNTITQTWVSVLQFFFYPSSIKWLDILGIRSF